ncbi:LysR family transcriptional regulator [Rhizobium leguminosarum]|uniref:LysR family transcriptional regulator n=1 Tax=Rhizobium leguminosarum TaxID=384 RepID=UPI00103893F9|nr:LysR family transcriptional regulator [Rhizobium leguminosarum]MBY5494224.1 LysR family transcriptional regulator [Rhizobium leguminosarum]NKK46916.1 LysR family transcriptional regulator [Rhizobium leguminosarum bv. viciae]TBZ28056.1 LysR family transcriptional regulator [Rhizobium leguminosarum bv. viciae]TCA06458.1 LysR family transcriptional regulator [Rhizobium leguminosarum bv. viciae]TCA19666.1 LysR family transcriptional regulator [Rhizobium leguminosarum bv. viciae]
MRELNERRLRYFYNVALHGSIRRAAEELNTAPSVVTRQLRLLEQEMGVKLFERDVSGSRPTDAAQFLLDYWHSSRSLMEILEERIEETRTLKRGKVYVSLSEGFLVDFIDNVLKRFNKDFPKIELSVNVHSVGDIVDQVASDVAHLGIVYNPPKVSYIRSFLHVDVPIKLFVSRDHELAKTSEPITLARALSYPIAKMPSIFGLGRTTELLADSERIPLNVVFTSNSSRSVAHFICNGTAVAFLGPRYVAAEFGNGELQAIEIAHPLLTDNQANVIARTARAPTKAMTIMIEYIKKYSKIFGQR